MNILLVIYLITEDSLIFGSPRNETPIFSFKRSLVIWNFVKMHKIIIPNSKFEERILILKFLFTLFSYDVFSLL